MAITIQLIIDVFSLYFYDFSQLMLCHSVGGPIPGLDVVFDASFGYSCSMMQFFGSVLQSINLSALTSHLETG